MAFMDLFRRSAPATASSPHVSPHADGSGFLSMDDPRVVEFLRFGDITATGISVNVERALQNPAMFRAVSVISFAIGMLPLQLIREETKQKATDHPLYRVLHRRPNSWQSAFDFRTLMQLRALVKGNGYALVLRSIDLRNRGAEKVSGLIPLDPDRMEPKQLDDWSVVYDYRPKTGSKIRYTSRDILHIRGLSLDGIVGLSTVKQASEAIALALAAQLAAGRVFKHGAFVGGTLEHPGKLSDPAFDRLRASLAEKEGADNAGKSLILEEGMKWAATVSSTARDAQLIDVRKMQIEEIGRATGVPRPLLMMDDTSWGSGIAELGRFFVQFGLNPWFEAWQQACERVLLSDTESDTLAVKFNAGAFLRGSMKDQAEFFSKALGSGGAPAWMTQNEVRDVLDMPRVAGGDDLSKGAMGHNGGPALEDPPDEPAQKPKRSPKKDDDDED